MVQQDEQWQRIVSIVGDLSTENQNACLEKFYQYLQACLQLLCEVVGIEDFEWEEIYVFGPGSRAEYQKLRLTRPSYKDRFDLLEVEKGVRSRWMMFPNDDLAAHVRRKSDGKAFRLGLSELEVVGKDSLNKRLLDDYSVWFANSR